MCPEYAKDIFDYLKRREVSQTLNGSLNQVFFFRFKGALPPMSFFKEGKSVSLLILLSAGKVCPL